MKIHKNDISQEIDRCNILISKLNKKIMELKNIQVKINLNPLFALQEICKFMDFDINNLFSCQKRTNVYVKTMYVCALYEYGDFSLHKIQSFLKYKHHSSFYNCVKIMINPTTILVDEKITLREKYDKFVELNQDILGEKKNDINKLMLCNTVNNIY